jgi:hypothetical protein
VTDTGKGLRPLAWVYALRNRFVGFNNGVEYNVPPYFIEVFPSNNWMENSLIIELLTEFFNSNSWFLAE